MKRLPLAIRKLGIGAAVATSVFLGFVLYAFLAPATYRTQTSISLEFPKGIRPGTTAQTTRLLERTVFGTGADSRGSVKIDTADGRLYTFVVTDSSAERAQK